MAAPSFPGAEAYADGHARAAAIPQEQRSRDVRSFLEAHALLDQAAAVLCRSHAPESERAEAFLQCATTAYSGLDLQPNGLSHPGCLLAFNMAVNGHNVDLIMPFVRVRMRPGTDQAVEIGVNDRLIQQVASPTASPVRSVETIAWLLLVARVLT